VEASDRGLVDVRSGAFDRSTQFSNQWEKGTSIGRLERKQALLDVDKNSFRSLKDAGAMLEISQCYLFFRHVYERESLFNIGFDQFRENSVEHPVILVPSLHTRRDGLFHLPLIPCTAGILSPKTAPQDSKTAVTN
jgi:hypothetical protein